MRTTGFPVGIQEELGMADLGKTLKGALIKGMEAIGTAANNIASNTKYKMDEMNMVNRRREILGDFGARAYELWQKGTCFPEELEQQLQELSELDTKLNELRMQKLSNVENDGKDSRVVPVIDVQEPDLSAESPVEDETIVFPEEPEATGTVEVVPLSDAIDQLFEKTEEPVAPAVNINDEPDYPGNTLQDFSAGLGEQNH